MSKISNKRINKCLNENGLRRLISKISKRFITKKKETNKHNIQHVQEHHNRLI